MSASYKFRREGKEYGPVTARELRALAAEGRLSAHDLIWKEGMRDWAPAGKLKGLFDERPKGQEPPGTLPPPPAAAGGFEPATANADLDRSPGAAALRLKLGRGLEEVKQAAAATAAQGQRLVAAGKDLLLERRLHAEAEAAQAAFGDWLHKAQLGDEDLRRRLTEANEQLLSQASARKSTREAAAERLRLQLLLAEPYLLQNAPPGAEAEHQKALAARQALQVHRDASQQARQTLLPADHRDRLRIVTGLGAVLVLIGFVYWLTRGSGNQPVVSPARGTVAVGGSTGAAPTGAATTGAAPTDAVPVVGDNNPAKAEAQQRMLEAEAAYQQAAAVYNAAHESYRMQRNTALAQAGRRGAMGLPPATVTPPDPRLQLEMMQAQKAYEEAKRAYEQIP